MKKILAMVLCLLMITGIFAGCRPDTDEPDDGKISDTIYETDENGQFVYGDLFKDVTVEWWVSSHYELNSDMFFFKKLEEVIGCKINVTCYEGDTYITKVNTALQTGSLPDICTMVTGYSVYNVYGDQGAFVNLLDEKVLAKMPNLKKNLLDVPEAAQFVDAYKSENGALYGMPRYNTQRLVNYGWMYRKDIFEKHGIEMWTDSESFLNVLRQLKKLYPDSYPLTGAAMKSVFGRVINGYGANSYINAYDWDKKEWFMGAGTEGFYEMMKLFQTAWNENLVDPDIFTNKVNDIDSAILNGTSFVYNSWIGRMAVENPAGKDVDPNFQVSYAPQIGDGKADQLSVVGTNGTVINAKSKCIDACLAIWNYLYSEEGVYVLTIGEEGVTYDMVNGERVYKNANGSVMENATIQTLEEEFGLWNEGIYALVNRESVYFNFTEEEAEAQEIGSKGGFRQGIPAYTIPEEYAEDFYDMLTNLNNDVEQFCAQFVTRNLSKEDWQKSVALWQSKYGRAFEILNGKY